ncbi:hypothetical protein FKM82_007477 [Ascaphus truei]
MQLPLHAAGLSGPCDGIRPLTHLPAAARGHGCSQRCLLSVPFPDRAAGTPAAARTPKLPRGRDQRCSLQSLTSHQQVGEMDPLTVSGMC